MIRKFATILFASLFLNFTCSFAQTEVKIGNQIWMTKNLDVVTFRNGDTIPEAKSDNEWWKANEDKKPAWCYYENNDVKGAKYGKLYNWYALNDNRGLAPLGWKLPSNKDWSILIDFVGHDYPMKLISGKDWLIHNSSNEAGFSALPGGKRDYDGYFTGSKDDERYAKLAFFWTSTERVDVKRLAEQVEINKSYVHLFDNIEKATGASIRCIKE
jgi:uncharacterized protein (TIGR02145 family)